MSDHHYTPLEGARDLAASARIDALSFGMTIDAATRWFTQSGEENLRVLRVKDDVVGTLLRIPMGQFFGGKSLPMLGVAGVGVAPEMRSRGYARRMMTDFLHEARADGFALSCLYASTQTLYRQVGYESAGHAFRYRVPLSLDREARTPRELRVVPLDTSHLAQVTGCYRTYAARHNGMVDRGPYCWGRVEARRETTYTGFGLVGADGVFEAYVYLAQVFRPNEFMKADLVISDLAFTTPRGAAELLAFVRDYATISDTAVLLGGPMHPWLTLLPQQRFTTEKHEYWLLRVVDLAKALVGRGYHRAVDAKVALEIVDGVLPHNHGTWTLHVSGGVAKAQRGGAGTLPILQTDARGLAAIYSGFLSATQAVDAGLVVGDPDALEACDAIFAGTAPSMVDLF